MPDPTKTAMNAAKAILIDPQSVRHLGCLFNLLSAPIEQMNQTAEGIHNGLTRDALTETEEVVAIIIDSHYAPLVEALENIHDIGYGRDGYVSAKDLGELVDELVEIANAALAKLEETK